MDIYISQRKYPSLFTGTHWVDVILSPSEHLVTLTGIVWLKQISLANFQDPTFNPDNAPDYKGDTSASWRWDKLHLWVTLPITSWLQLHHWAPFITLSSIFNQDQAINAGWAVDDFGIDQPNAKVQGVLPIWASLAVRDSDGYIYRVGYNVTLTAGITSPP